MVDLTLGDPRGALLFLLLMTTIGVVLGGGIIAIVAFPRMRRPRFRNFGAMPRTGVMCGVAAALFIICIGWNNAFAEFYRIEIRNGMARLYYHMPERSPELPLESITGMRRGMTMDKLSAWRIELEAGERTYYSTNMSRSQLDTVWKVLADFVKPLE